MADYTFDFSAQADANPWTPSAPIIKLSSNNLRINNGSGVRSAVGTQVTYGAHDADYALGATQVLAEVDIGTIVFASDRAGPGIFARSGPNAGAGYCCLPDNYGGIYVYRVSAAGALTQIGYIGSITLAANDVIGLGYVQSTDTLTVYQNTIQRTTVTDATYNADTTLAPGWLTDPQNINGQYIKTLAGTGQVLGPTIVSVDDSTPADGGTLVITCTGAGGTEGSVTIDGVAQQVDAWADDEITITLSDIRCFYNTNVDLIVIDSDDNASPAEVIQVVPPTGWDVVTFGTLAADRVVWSPDIETGFQGAWGDVVGGTINEVTWFDDGSIAGAENVVRCKLKVNDGTDWSTIDTFYFTQQNNSALAQPLAQDLAQPLAKEFIP